MTLNKNMIPEGGVWHSTDTFTAITVPDDGFERLIAYKKKECKKWGWVNPNYRIVLKKEKNAA